MAGPYKGRRVALENILYPRYEAVEDLLNAPAAANNRQKAAAAPAIKRPHPDSVPANGSTSVAAQPAADNKTSAALLAEAEAAAAAGMDPEAVAALQRKAAKRAKREERRKSTGATPEPQPAQPAQDVDMQPADEAPAQLNGTRAEAAPQSKASKQVAAAGNAEEAAKIRAALGYVAPTTQAPDKPVAAAQPAATQGGGFEFGFSVAQRIAAETDAKIARIMAIDSTKDGFVPRRVWACGMPHEFSEDQIREYWQYCGEVESLDLLTFKDSNRFNGAAFITFKTQEGFEAALAADGEELEGRKLRVEKCKVPVPKKSTIRVAGQGQQTAPAVVKQAAAPAPVAPVAAAPAPARAAQPAETDGEYNVAYVGNISFETTEDELTQLFKQYNVTQIRLHVDQKTGRPKGFAHVHFSDAPSLKKALAVDGTQLHDRNLKVLQAQPPKKK